MSGNQTGTFLFLTRKRVSNPTHKGRRPSFFEEMELLGSFSGAEIMDLIHGTSNEKTAKKAQDFLSKIKEIHGLKAHTFVSCLEQHCGRHVREILMSYQLLNESGLKIWEFEGLLDFQDLRQSVESGNQGIPIGTCTKKQLFVQFTPPIREADLAQAA